MEILAFDIEANGLNEIKVNSKGQATKEANRIWCASSYSISTGEAKGYTEEEIPDLIRRLGQADLVVGHNICSYDLPLLYRLYGNFSVNIYDTLLVSRLIWPDKPQLPNGSHSLKSWGLFLGEYKDDYQGGFDEYNEEMLKYCIQDSVVTAKVFNYQKEFATKNTKAIRLEHKVAEIVAQQVENGFSFDLNAAEILEAELLMHKASVEDEMQIIFPAKVEERWSEKTGKRLKDKVTIFNPGSRQQIADRLHEKYSWKYPTTDKGNPKVDRSVLKKLDYPEAGVLVKYFDNTKLMSQVSDWIIRARASRDHKIHGSLNTLGTVTGRMTSNNPNMQQVSSDPRARSLFVPRSNWVLVGSDLKGLELRMLAHYLHKHDGGAYAEQILSGDIHEHNQEAMGVGSRNQAKSGIYCFIYGGGDTKFGQVIGASTHDAKLIKNKFLSNITGLRQVMDDCKFDAASKGSVRPFNWREIPVRSEHAALNTLLQSSGALVAKIWACFAHDTLTKQFPNQWSWVANVHDEVQVECAADIAHEVGQILCESSLKAGDLLGCTIPTEAEYNVGKNWSETH
jgi:DNA polymerase I-like protein with 3'-5' exonuclease and polymerase domains